MTMSLHQARVLIEGAEAKARAIGVPVVIAVLDSGTHLKALARMDGAVLASIDIAVRKARTSVLFEVDSERVWDYCKPGAPAPALELGNGGLAPFGGGVPIRDRDGGVIGAVGVSGGSVAQDVDVSTAAVGALNALRS